MAKNYKCWQAQNLWQIIMLLSKKTIFSMLFVAALAIVLEQQWSNVDLRLADYFYSQVQHSFLWRGTWFAKTLMHSYVKECIILMGILLVFLAMADAIAPLNCMQHLTRMRVRFVAIAAVIVPAIIALLKHFSILHCPSDLVRYGGNAEYMRLFDALPAGAEAGQCFPAGHASTGLWLAAFCVFWLPQQPKKALGVFAAGLCIGFALGWVQQMRGEHFLSHTLWSVWLASTIIALMLAFSPPFHLNKKAYVAH